MFDRLIEQSHIKNEDKVKLSDYQRWQKLFSFDALRGKKYGESFCNYFKISDYRLFYERNWEHCDRIIRSDWLVRT